MRTLQNVAVCIVDELAHFEVWITPREVRRTKKGWVVNKAINNPREGNWAFPLHHRNVEVYAGDTNEIILKYCGEKKTIDRLEEFGY